MTGTVAGAAFRVLAALIVGTILDAMAGVTGLALYLGLGGAAIWPSTAVYVLATVAGAAVLIGTVGQLDPEAPPPSMLAVVVVVLLGGLAWVSTLTAPMAVTYLVGQGGTDDLVTWSTVTAGANLVIYAVRYGGWMAALILAFVRARPPRP